MRKPIDRRRRRPLALLPLVLLLWGLFLGWSLISSLLTNGPVLAEAMQMARQNALTALAQGNTAGADKAMEQAAALRIAAGSLPGAAYAQVGQEMTRAGQSAAAARFLTRATEKAEMAWDPVLWDALADARDNANDDAGADRARTEAEKRAAQILASGGDGGKGRAMDKAARLVEAGVFYADDKRRDADHAIQALRAANDLAPGLPLDLQLQILNALGYTLADLGTTTAQFDDAVIYTRRAVKMLEENNHPPNGSILDSFGWALYKHGDLAGARRVLAQAVELAGSIPEVHYHLAMVYKDLNQPDDARRELALALQLRPDYPAAKAANASLSPKS